MTINARSTGINEHGQYMTWEHGKGERPMTDTEKSMMFRDKGLVTREQHAAQEAEDIRNHRTIQRRDAELDDDEMELGR